MSQSFERVPKPIEPEPDSNKPKESKGPESELSPEVIERVMEKVQDVHQKGSAYHAITHSGDSSNRQKGFNENLERMHIVFKNGLLGSMENTKKPSFTKLSLEEKEKATKEKWAKNLRTVSAKERKRMGESMIGGVFFSLSKPDVTPKNYIRDYGQVSDSIVVIFDYERVQKKNKSVYDIQGPEAGESTISFRVAPRFFNGIAFEPGKINVFSYEEQQIVDRFEELGTSLFGFSIDNELSFKDINQYIAKSPGTSKEKEEFVQIADEVSKRNLMSKIEHYWWGKYGEAPGEELKKKRAEEIARTMMAATKSDADLLVPVYDLDGNLWWPKQMSYDEVKRFVAEREKKGPQKPQDPNIPTE